MAYIDILPSLYSPIANKYMKLTVVSPWCALIVMDNATRRRYSDWPCSSEMRPDENGLYGLQSLSSSRPIICANNWRVTYVHQWYWTHLVLDLLNECQATHANLVPVSTFLKCQDMELNPYEGHKKRRAASWTSENNCSRELWKFKMHQNNRECIQRTGGTITPSVSLIVNR